MIVPYFSIVVGVLLCVLTAVGVTEAESNQLETTFLPMLVGVPFFVGGSIALNPRRRRQALLSTAIVAIVGMFAWGCVFTHMWQFGTGPLSREDKLLVQYVANGMGVLCVAYLATWCIYQTFRRRTRHLRFVRQPKI